VAVAAFVADYARMFLIGPQPPFVVSSVHHVGASGFAWALVVGLCGGIVSMIMTKLVYLTEDAYEHLPIHWMWWPAIGGLLVGVGGWFVPAALGVGYPTISSMVNGHMAIGIIAGIIIVKIVIWIGSLSSGTSGGVLAPLLMIGAATGSLVAQVIPGHDVAVWAIVGMAALMGGTMRAPFMGTLFALETTHAWALAPEIFIGCVAATAFTVVFVPRSILTEKLSRRGVHVARDYAVHPLELIAVREAMHPCGDEHPRLSIDAHARVRSAADLMAESGERALMVIDGADECIGVIDADDLLRAWRGGMQAEHHRHRVRRFHRRPSQHA